MLKILAISSRPKYERFDPQDLATAGDSIVFAGESAEPAEAAALAPDAEVVFADAISPVPAELINALPQLRMVCSEGVAYNKIDCDAAAKRGIYVTNNAGGNAGAVAEQAVLLMLGLLHRVVSGDASVRAGRQIEAKHEVFSSGQDDIMDMTVGIIGLGAIGQALAARLTAFGCRVIYNSHHRKPELEEKMGIEWAERDDLLAQSDFVSLNCAVTSETTGMANEAFFAQMKQGARLINTARGELVDNASLVKALESGHLAGAGIDTLAPEPVTPDNPLLHLSQEASERVLFSPHIAGITNGSMRRMQQHMWQNVRLLGEDKRPTCVVNGI